MPLYRRILHAIDNHGLRGLALRAWNRLIHRRGSGPAFNELAEPHPFDRLHATDTSGHISGEVLTPSNLYNTAYYAISPSTLTHALQLLPEPVTGFDFVDLGCGKGRALLVAAQFPFAHIRGVELSAELCDVARVNTAADTRIAVEQADAVTVTYPDAPLVVYLYHPFLAPMLRKVLANLERQRRESPHPTYLLYANCRYEKTMAGFPFMQVVWDYSIPLSAEDAAADRHGTTQERFTLYRAHP
jgi:SAM-dependent methyltransferase